MPEPFASHILCPIDFSDLSAAALQFAARLSIPCRAEVTALHAYWFDPPPYFTPAYAEELKRQFQDATGQIQALLQQFAQTAGTPDARLRVVGSDPVEAILSAAREIRSDLIVMGTHGRSGIRRFMLGSIAERVLRTSPVPVVTVREPLPAEGIGQILCPVNNSAASRSALAKAAHIATCLDARLVALHIEEDDPRTRIDDLCEWVAAQPAPSCTIEQLRGKGNPAEEILKIAAESHYGLLVIGAAHQPFFDSTILGSTTVRVVRHAPCPVLTVVEGTGENRRQRAAA